MSQIISQDMSKQLQDLKDKLSSVEISLDAMSLSQLKLLTEKVNDLAIYTENVRKIDTDLQGYYLENHHTKNNNQIILYDDFPNKMEHIPNDALIIYIKKAQLYKVYNSNNLGDFINDNNTHFSKPHKFGTAYEVVRDSHPQRLMIIMNDIEDENLDEIKARILEYIEQNKDFSNTTIKDLKTYSDDISTEFMLSNIHLTDMAAKELFIERFIRFMRKKGESELANKIQVKPPPSDVEGVRFYKLPGSKTELDIHNKMNLVDQLVTSTKHVVIHNTYIYNDNSVNNNNVNNSINNVVKNVTKNSTKRPVKKTLKTFYQHIYDDKPDWYKENTFVLIDIIEREYRNYFNDETTSKNVISKKLNGSLFTGKTRVNNVNKKKLVSYEALGALLLTFK